MQGGMNALPAILVDGLSQSSESTKTVLNAFPHPPRPSLRVDTRAWMRYSCRWFPESNTTDGILIGTGEYSKARVNEDSLEVFFRGGGKMGELQSGWVPTRPRSPRNSSSGYLEDATQDAKLNFLSKRRCSDGPLGVPDRPIPPDQEPYLRWLARKRATDYRRRQITRDRHVRELAVRIPAPRPSLSDDLALDLRDALSKLNARDRYLLEAKFGISGEAICQEEVAATLGVTTRTVRTALRRAEEQLRAVLAKGGYS